MNQPTETSSFIRILKKEIPVGRCENVDDRSFISTNSADFPPLPKANETVKDKQQKGAATYSRKLKYKTLAKEKDTGIQPDWKESIGNVSHPVAEENLSRPIHVDTPSKSECHFKGQEQQTRADSAAATFDVQASSEQPLERTSEAAVHMMSKETILQSTKSKSRKGKKKKKSKQQQGGKIALVTPEMHHILSGERDSSCNVPKCVVDINSIEEYPELDQSKPGTLPSTIQKSAVKTDMSSSVLAISGGVASSKSHDRTSYGWSFTRSFSDLLKTTSTPTSLKFRTVIQDKNSIGASENIPIISPSLNKEEMHKRSKLTASKLDSSLPKAEKETLNLHKTKKTEGDKISKKIPNTRSPLNMSDFIVGVQSGRIKKSHVKSTGLEKKVNSLTPHNMLDSTAPLRKRGKERERPKKKQLSTLKKIILRERELKKMLLTKDLVVELNVPQETVSNENSPLVVSSGSVDGQSNDECKNLDDTSVVKNLEVLVKTDTLLEKTNAREISLTPVEKSLKVDKRTIIAKQIIHSRNFREYCDQFISEEIDKLLSTLLQELVRYQDRLYEKDPIKAKVRRRLVCGLKEVTKHLKMKKLKVLLVAPNVERINSEGGLDDKLTTLLKLSVDHSTPCVFGLTRRKMGNILRKTVPVSCVGIFNYEGTEETFKPLMESVKEARALYEEYFQRICDLLEPELIESLGESISEDEKRDIWRKITKDNAPDGWALDSLNRPNSYRKIEE